MRLAFKALAVAVFVTVMWRKGSPWNRGKHLLLPITKPVSNHAYVPLSIVPRNNFGPG